VKDAFVSRLWIVLLSSLADLATEIHFGRGKAEHAITIDDFQ